MVQAISEQQLRAAKKAEFDNWVKRGSATGATPHNIGGAGVVVVPDDITGQLNRVVLATSATVPYFDAIFSVFAAHQRLPQWDILPSNEDQTPLFNALTTRGYAQRGFKSILGGIVDNADAAMLQQATAHQLAPADIDAATDLYVYCFAIDRAKSPRRIAGFRALLENTDTLSFGIRRDEQLVAFGIMTLHTDVAFLSTAVTHPDYRGKGFQQSLLKMRMAVGFRGTITFSPAPPTPTASVSATCSASGYNCWPPKPSGGTSMGKEYKNIIFTDHALERMKRRRISQDMVVQTVRKPDRKEDEDDDKIRFVKEIKERNIQIVARHLDDEKKWMVVTAWVRGEDDPRRWWVHMLLLPWYAVRIVLRIVRTIVRLQRR